LPLLIRRNRGIRRGIVVKKYPAMSKTTEGLIVRLDAAPKN
jgi:hypothetical protein